MTKILVIEDELTVRENLVELLEAEGYETYGTENGLIGTIWAYNNFPDLIICDVMMPEIDGYEVLSGLQSNSLTASIPFIFLTAKADKTDIRQGMNLGADDYLTKPFTRRDVLDAISSRLSKHKKLLETYQQELQRTQALQEKLIEMEDSLQQKELFLKNLQQDLSQALPQLQIALNILKKSQPVARRKDTLKMIQRLCIEELNLLQKIPHFKELFSPEDVKLIQEILQPTS